MTEIFLPSLNFKFFDKQNESNNKIKTKTNNNNINIFRNNILGNNYLNIYGNKSLKKSFLNKSVNNNKINTNLKKAFIHKNFKYNNKLKGFFKNRTVMDIENNNKDINKKSYILINNKSYNNFNFINNTEKALKNLKNNYINTDIYNDRELNINDNKNKKDSKSIEVKKIIDSLTNSTKEENQDLFLKNNNINIKFPLNKTVDPFSYIKFNLQNNPYNKTLYKGVKTIMKKMGKRPLKEEYENNLIEKAREVNNLKVDSNHIRAPLGEAKNLIKQFDDMIKQTKKYKSFSFNKNENPQSIFKMKYYKPYNSILDKNYKNYFNKNFKINIKETDNKNKVEKNKTNSDIELENNIDKYLSFDMRINNILYISRKTENNINRKSKEHEDMLNKFNFILNSYFK